MRLSYSWKYLINRPPPPPPQPSPISVWGADNPALGLLTWHDNIEDSVPCNISMFFWELSAVKIWRQTHTISFYSPPLILWWFSSTSLSVLLSMQSKIKISLSLQLQCILIFMLYLILWVLSIFLLPWSYHLQSTINNSSCWFC